MRRRLALLTLAATLVALPAVAAERVTVKPRHGDVNTRFVFRGTGWKPDAELEYSYGPFCAASAACPASSQFKDFESDANGEFTQTLGPWKRVPSDFVGTDLCFTYRLSGGCAVTKGIGLTPPSASVTPADVKLFEDAGPVTMTVAAEHFRAGERLKIHLRFPDGRHRTIDTRARRHGARVGGANAWAPRGGVIEHFQVRTSDPDGTYRVRIADRHGGEAVTSFVCQHYVD